jgi:hypothetical protein
MRATRLHEGNSCAPRS